MRAADRLPHSAASVSARAWGALRKDLAGRACPSPRRGARMARQKSAARTLRPELQRGSRRTRRRAPGGAGCQQERRGGEGGHERKCCAQAKRSSIYRRRELGLASSGIRARLATRRYRLLVIGSVTAPTGSRSTARDELGLRRTRPATNSARNELGSQRTRPAANSVCARRSRRPSAARRSLSRPSSRRSPGGSGVRPRR